MSSVGGMGNTVSHPDGRVNMPPSPEGRLNVLFCADGRAFTSTLLCDRDCNFFHLMKGWREFVTWMVGECRTLKWKQGEGHLVMCQKGEFPVLSHGEKCCAFLNDRSLTSVSSSNGKMHFLTTWCTHEGPILSWWKPECSFFLWYKDEPCLLSRWKGECSFLTWWKCWHPDLKFWVSKWGVS